MKHHSFPHVLLLYLGILVCRVKCSAKKIIFYFDEIVFSGIPKSEKRDKMRGP